MASRTCSPAWPLHGDFAEIAPPPGNQRWTHGRHSWARRSAGGFRQELYFVEAIPESVAKKYVLTHHYSRSYPSASRRYGLFYKEESGPALVGVAVFGIPMQVKVLTNVMPELEPYKESLELNRFVLEGERLTAGAPQGRAPANSETWFLAKALRLLSQDGVKGVVAFSDPVAREVTGERLWPGHIGTIYQAKGAVYTGRGTARSITVLKDGTTLPDRSISKVRNREQGHEYVERRLFALGARPFRGGDPTRWLQHALDDVGARRLRHKGCHRYVMATSSGNRRSLYIAIPRNGYPKQIDGPGLED